MGMQGVQRGVDTTTTTTTWEQGSSGSGVAWGAGGPACLPTAAQGCQRSGKQVQRGEQRLLCLQRCTRGFAGFGRTCFALVAQSAAGVPAALSRFSGSKGGRSG
jgi:hypothetical protein